MNDEITAANLKKFEELEARVKELEDKLTAHDAFGAGEKIQENDENTKAEARHLYKELEPFLEKFRNDSVEIEEAISAKIRRYPCASVALAFGAGLIAAAIFDNRKQ